MPTQYTIWCNAKFPADAHELLLAGTAHHHLIFSQNLQASNLSAIAATLPAVRRRDRLVKRSLPVMGTIVEFSVVHCDPLRAEAAIDAAYAELTRVERMMTAFSPLSD